MRAEEIKGLMEAYSKVNATPEVLNEEVVELSDEDLEGIELIEMTMEEIEQLDEQGGAGGAAAQTAKRQRVAAQGQVKTALGQGKGIGLQSASGLGQGTKPGQKAFGTQMGGRQGVVVKGGASGPNYGPRGGSSFTRAADTVNVGGQTLYKAKKGNDIVYLQGKGKPQLFKPGQSSPAKPGTPAAPAKPGTPGSSSPAKPGTPAAPAKPGNTTGGKPTTPAAPQKPKGSAMDQWRAANPKLAAAADEKARIRGTSQTDNPLMKDMRSKMSMTPSVQSPTLAKDLGGGSGNQSLLNNPNASKAATPKPAAAAKPTTPTKPSGFDLAKKGVNLAAGVDLFDLVKGHLLDEGYADSEEGAMVIMVNMSEEWRKSILESYGVQQLDEISQKTATRAFASSKTGEFEGADSDRDVKRTNNLKKHIVRKFGKEAGEHAEKAAEVQTFGRKDASGKSKGLPKSRIEKSDYRTTQDGKMHKQDQRELKTELRIKRDRRLRKEDLEAWVDELIAEGYDLSEYTWEEVAEIYAHELELSEAQRARENPEDHDKEEKRKYEPVRGERTPMPPRGDKRREEFEKWYAKQMGR